MKLVCILNLLVVGGLGLDLSISDFIRGLTGNCPVVNGPACPPEITYWLYSRSNKKGIQLDPHSLASAPFVVGAPLKILVHGYWNDRNSEFNKVLRKAYFQHAEYNIISVDWGEFVKVACYLPGVESIPNVAKCVAFFTNALFEAKQFHHVHMLGHSLGGHVSAWASYDIKPQLRRLTVFDPALPMFEDKITKPGVADFIDVYHSNCGYAGQTASEGTVDVYFNNESFQPGCKCDIQCSHIKGVKYYAESIVNGGEMKAFPCHSFEDYANERCPVPTTQELATVGYKINKSIRGRFFVFTESNPPYLIKSHHYLTKNSFFRFLKGLSEECDVTDAYAMVTKWLTGEQAATDSKLTTHSQVEKDSADVRTLE